MDGAPAELAAVDAAGVPALVKEAVEDVELAEEAAEVKEAVKEAEKEVEANGLAVGVAAKETDPGGVGDTVGLEVGRNGVVVVEFAGREDAGAE